MLLATIPWPDPVFQWDPESYRDGESFCRPDPEFKQDPESYGDRESHRNGTSTAAPSLTLEISFNIYLSRLHIIL